MESKSLPQTLPRLIPADQVLPTMKSIIKQYQAVREGIIQDVSPETATFGNVIQPLINIDNATQGVIGIIAMLRYASPDQASREASEEACTLINEDQAAFTASSDFWHLIKAVKEGSDEKTLHFEAQKYLNKLFLEFEQFGHGTLQPEQIEQYMERRNRIDSMRREYNRRIREDSGGLWFSLDDLAGVPQHDIDRFEKHSENHDMRFVRFSVADSLAVYRSASKPTTRKRMYICDANNLSQNAELFKQIVLERDLNARLLGYESHAAYRIKKRLMKTPGKVEEFLTDLETKLLARGKQDMKSLVELKKQHEAENSIDESFDGDTMFPWDYWYYARMAQQLRHVNQESMAKYFPLQHVIKVMLEMFSEFLETQFCPISPDQLQGSVWHQDVQAWAVWDDGEASKGQFIGYLYVDLLSRDNKYKGNQNVNLQCSYLKGDGTRVYPATILMCSFPRSKPSDCTLLKHGQIVSLFHELGHGIHDLVARTSYVAFHGHRSPPDFAEALSVMLENWCWMEPELKRLGLHYTRTDPQLKEKWLQEHPGEELPPAQIPDDMIKRLTQGRQVTRSLWFLRQMVYARFDMAVHHPKSHAELLEMDFTKVYYDLMEKLWLVRAPEPGDQGYPHADLGHLILSAHVFAAELFESTFLEDPRSVSAWEKYRKGILEFGGSRDELGLLEEYLGHTPTAEALLRDILQ
ncbi:related to metalloproteinase [Fusarium fujikuroi IMI 58289]|uniref:Related to metalloproteinase n=1 Tax=Gibberella fujikuroi (strain CBS 195.34 / IMI 58289 / NRRL A-6831) TaxID=1279085 RepID=S0DSX2_GIBF5|nr:related to metalloproteinase [Fusarium fujikuroi IMI 58289]QGI90870.1 hypothetical protein CEK26_003939 [Fusarium fujikuroi]CCT63683.1 related to metalloproteinase [Fusarium fujikuroi IMI 58289]SCN98446.1 related to metalloproteinase [Fusarium fujikuroi]